MVAEADAFAILFPEEAPPCPQDRQPHPLRCLDGVVERGRPVEQFIRARPVSELEAAHQPLEGILETGLLQLHPH